MSAFVVADIGGTHARFALAEPKSSGVELSHEIVLSTSAFAGPAEAWRAYEDRVGRSLPRQGSIAIAAPVSGNAVRMVNNHWAFDWEKLAGQLKLERLTRLNDFEAIAFAVPACAAQLRHICGPDVALAEDGIISVVGPGTGLGVAILDGRSGASRVIGTEGSHIAFAPLDETETRARNWLAERHGRVSVERVASGPGLRALCAALGHESEADDLTLWKAALAGTDPVAAEALRYFVRCLGSAIGDLALAHGSHAVVVAGGLGLRLAEHLQGEEFAARFADKGRYRPRMEAMPVKLLTHPQPGLLGAALAHAASETQANRASLQG